jgi:hypothetical protein
MPLQIDFRGEYRQTINVYCMNGGSGLTRANIAAATPSAYGEAGQDRASSG